MALRTNVDDPLFLEPAPFDNLDSYVPVLAAGDLNNDGVADFVGERDVFLSGAVPYTKHAIPTQIPASDATVREVVLADMNGDGWPDLVASFSDDHIEVLNNAENGVFNRLAIPTTGPASNLTVGDFDGDLIDDVAFSEATAQAANSTDPNEAHGEMAVLFGRAAGAPEPPIHIGQFSTVDGIVTGRDLLPLGTLGDAMDDLAVLWKPPIAGRQRQAVFPASTDRRLQSPFILVETDKTPFDKDAIFSPLHIAIGDFDNDGHADVAALTDKQGGEYRLWRLRATEEAQIDVEDVAWTTLNPSLKKSLNMKLHESPRWDAALLGAVDVCGLDNPGDEVVLLVPDATGLKSELWIGEVHVDGKHWKLRPHITELAAPSWAAMQIQDVDGDGCRDIIALSTAPGSEVLAVFWNRNSIGAPNELRFDEGGLSGVIPTAFVCAELEDKPTRDQRYREILLLSLNKAFLVSPDPNTGKLPVSERELPGGTSVAAGDIDHDGVADLAILGEGALQLFRSTPRVR
jgi:hypothetical protein